jgi:hypothetical protein
VAANEDSGAKLPLSNGYQCEWQRICREAFLSDTVSGTASLWIARSLKNLGQIAQHRVEATETTSGSQPTELRSYPTLFVLEAFLEEQEKRQALMVVELKDEIQAGIVSGTGVPAEEVFDRLEQKYATMGQSGNG